MNKQHWQTILPGALFALIIGGCAQPETGPPREQVEKLVRDSLMSWETGDEAALVATADEERLLFAFPGTRTDAAGAVRVFRYWQEHFTDTRVYIHQVLVDGNRFAAEYQFATTKKSNGKRTAASTIAIGEVNDGRITLLKEYVDGRVSRLQESGELPLEEGEEPFPWPSNDKVYPWTAAE